MVHPGYTALGERDTDVQSGPGSPMVRGILLRRVVLVLPVVKAGWCAEWSLFSLRFNVVTRRRVVPVLPVSLGEWAGNEAQRGGFSPCFMPRFCPFWWELTVYSCPLYARFRPVCYRVEVPVAQHHPFHCWWVIFPVLDSYSLF